MREGGPVSARVRVVQIVNGLEAAGAERVVVEIAGALPKDDFDTSVVVVRDGPLRADLEEMGIEVHVTGGGFDAGWPGVVSRISKHLRAIGPHIVNTHLIGSDIVGGLAARMARVPVIVSTQHDANARPLIYDLFRRYSARWLDAVIPVAPSLVEYCVRARHMSPDRIHPIENCVDVGRFAGIPTPPHEPFTIGCVGRLTPLKGHEVAVSALVSLRERMPGARLLVAGDGPGRDALQEAVSAAGMAGAVEMLGPVQDIPAFLDGIDVLVHPSLQEGLPLAVLEAMAAAKPIVASDIPSIRLALDGGRCGELVPPGDARALAGALVALAESPKRARNLALAARERAESRYSRERLGREYGDLYRALLAGTGAGRT